MKRNLICRWSTAVLVAIGGGQLAHANANAFPEAQYAGPVTYVSGGVGLDESQALQQATHNYPVVLEFAGKTAAGNKYFANVPITIVKAQGKIILETSARGPFLLVSLPDGPYTVAASYGEKTEKRSISVSPNDHVRETVPLANVRVKADIASRRQASPCSSRPIARVDDAVNM